MSHKRIRVRIFSLLVLAACAGRAPAPEQAATPEPTEPSRTTPLPSAGMPLPGRTSFMYAGGTGDYLIVSEATISAVDAATAGQPLTMTEQARVSLSVEPVTDFVLVNGRVQSLAQDPASSSPPFTLPASFVDTVWAEGSARLDPGPDQLCGRSQPPPRHVTSFLPTVARDLQQGQRWERSYIYSICQGPIPLRIERTDSYLVQGSSDAGPESIAIARSSTLRMAGRGVDGQHNVVVDGSGSARAMFHMDARAGQLVRGTEESTSDIGITASGRTQRFRQHTTRRINRL